MPGDLDPATLHLYQLGKWCENFRTYLDESEPKLTDKQQFELFKNIEAIGVILIDTVQQFPDYPHLDSIKKDISQYKSAIQNKALIHDEDCILIDSSDEEPKEKRPSKHKNHVQQQMQEPSSNSIGESMRKNTTEPSDYFCQEQHPEPDSREFYFEEPHSLHDNFQDSEDFEKVI